MGPKHKKHAGHGGHQQLSISYLTDDALAFDSEAAMATIASAPAPPPTRTNEEVNLAVLRRHYPAVTQILSIANFATLYTLHPQTQAWDKANCDGTLFVCALEPVATQAERYALIILNRRELKNFYLELLSPAMVEFEEPFVMLKDEDDGVSGLFISAEPAPASTAQMREINVGVIQECAARAEESRAAGAQQWKRAPDEGQGVVRERVPSQQQDPNYGYGGQEYYQPGGLSAQQQQQQQYQPNPSRVQQWGPQQQAQPQNQFSHPQHYQHQYPQQQQFQQHQQFQQQQQNQQRMPPGGVAGTSEHELLRLFARAKAGL